MTLTRYYELVDGDIIQAGDEFKPQWISYWQEVRSDDRSVGKPFRSGDYFPIRRKIDSHPLDVF